MGVLPRLGQKEYNHMMNETTETAFDEAALREAAQKGDGRAQHLLAIIDLDEDWGCYPVNDPEFAAGLEWVRKDADAGNPVSQYQYGEILIWACDIEKTMKDGLEYLKRSCANGYAKGALELGCLYADTGTDWGDAFYPDVDEAAKWYERGAELGSIHACDRLGEQLYRKAIEASRRINAGASSEEDTALVRRVFEVTKRAADAGCPCPMTRLAFMYADGMGVERDEGRAKECLLAAEKCGSGLATQCINLVARSGLTLDEAMDRCRDKVC